MKLRDRLGVIEQLAAGLSPEDQGRVIPGIRDFIELFAEELVSFHGEGRCWSEERREIITVIEEGRWPPYKGHDAWQAVRLAQRIHQSV